MYSVQYFQYHFEIQLRLVPLKLSRPAVMPAFFICVSVAYLLTCLACLSVCLSVCLFVCLSVCLSLCMSGMWVFFPANQFIRKHTCLVVRKTISIFFLFFFLQRRPSSSSVQFLSLCPAVRESIAICLASNGLLRRWAFGLGAGEKNPRQRLR